jgi:hypothetical protein
MQTKVYVEFRNRRKTDARALIVVTDGQVQYKIELGSLSSSFGAHIDKVGRMTVLQQCLPTMVGGRVELMVSNTFLHRYCTPIDTWVGDGAAQAVLQVYQQWVATVSGAPANAN